MKKLLSCVALLLIVAFVAFMQIGHNASSASSGTDQQLTSSSSDATSEPNVSDTPPNITPASSTEQTFTMESPAPYPALNQIIDNPVPAFSDERVFLKIARYDGTDTYRTDLELEPDQLYSLVIHIHNDADVELGFDGFAQGIQFTLHYPVMVDGDASLSALLSASNTIPQIVGSEITVHSSVPLHLIFGSADGELYPVIRYNYGLEAESETGLSVMTGAIDGIALITGQVGDLLPGNTTESGAYIYLYFRTEAVED